MLRTCRSFDMETSSAVVGEGCTLRGRSDSTGAGAVPRRAQHNNDYISWLDERCPRRLNFVSARRKYFETLANGGGHTNTINHVYSTYEIRHDGLNISDSSDKNVPDCASETDIWDDATSDELTVNSTEPSEDYPTEPSEENSHKDYGFYTIFPGVPDEELDDFSEISCTKLPKEDTQNTSFDKLCDVIKKEIDRMIGPVVIEDIDSEVNESENKNNEVIYENSVVQVNDAPKNLIVAQENDNKRNSIIRDLSGTINELLTTERSYVDDLDYVCKSYLLEMYSNDLPVGLQGKCSYIFGNFEKIKDFHKNEFLPALEKCEEDAEAICKVFTNFVDQLYCYTQYAMNKPLSNKLMKEEGSFFEKTRVAIGDVMGLSSFLLKPLQRLVKYRQLIERIGKNLRKLEIDDVVDYCGFEIKAKTTEYSPALTAAMAAEDFLTDLQQQGNDVLMLPYITKCPYPVESLRLVRSSKLIVNKRSIKYQVFLFETLLLFTEPIILNNEELFLYKDAIRLDRILPPVECQKSANSFTLMSSENKSRIFHIKCSNADERSIWMSAIRKILFRQQQAWKEAVKHKIQEPTPPCKQNEESCNKEPKSCSVEIPPIKKCPHKLDEMGQLRKCGKLTIKCKSFMYIGQVILYEKILIFTSIMNNHFEELLTHESSILAEHLCISQTMGTSTTKFHVWCNRTGASYILQAKSPEIKAAWIKQLDRIIGEQEALRLRNSLATRDSVLVTRTAPAMRSLRGVPGECNRRSLPPISTVWHATLDFDDYANNSGSADDMQNNQVSDTLGVAACSEILSQTDSQISHVDQDSHLRDSQEQEDIKIARDSTSDQAKRDT